MRKNTFIIPVIIGVLALTFLTFSLAREKRSQKSNQIKTQIRHAAGKSQNMNSGKGNVQTFAQPVEKQKQFGNNNKSFSSVQNSKKRKVTVSKDLKIKVLNKK